MPTNSFIFPVSGLGFARDACLASFAATVSGVSGVGYLSTGTYEIGSIYISDGFSLFPVSNPFTTTSVSIPAPVIFGDWVFYVLGGQLPTSQSTGGIEYFGGGSGGCDWNNVAFTGTHGLKVEATFGGVLGFNTAIPDVSFTVTGTELFSVKFQLLDTLPDQVEALFYDATNNTWYPAYQGTDLFGFGGFNLGPIVGSIGSWSQLTFTPANIGIPVGHVITGMAWGVYKSSSSANVSFSDTSNLNSVIVPIKGFIDTDRDNNVGFYILSHLGPLYQVPAVGAAALQIPLPTSPSFAYTGLTFNPVDGNPYIIGYDGTVYKSVSNAVSTVTIPAGGTSPPARWLYNDGVNNLFTMFPTSNKVGKYNIPGNTWTLTATPFTASLDTFFYSSSLGQVVAAGQNFYDLPDAATIADIAYAVNPTQLLVADSTPRVNAYNFTDGGWQFSQTIGGYTGIPKFMATEPDGLQALVTDTIDNQINVLTFTGGVWNQTSTVALTAPTAITIYTSGITQAAVCSPTNNRISFLNKSVNNWAVVQTLTITGASYSAVSTRGTTTQGVICNSTGVTFISFNGAVWTNKGSLALNPVPTLATTDSFNDTNNYLYAAGTSGGNTTVYIFQNNALIGQYSFSGTMAGLSVVDWEVVVPTVTGAINVGYYVGGQTSNVVSSATAPVSGSRAAWVSNVTDFVPFLTLSGPHDIWSFYSDSPQSLARISDSQVALLSGAVWTTIDVVDRNKVSSITTDTSGNIFAVTTDNDIYKWSSAGVLASGYPFTIQPPPGQEFGIPLGLSKLVWWRGSLWSASSLMGGLVKITV